MAQARIDAQTFPGMQLLYKCNRSDYSSHLVAKPRIKIMQH
jgi:hypothetical protein